MNKWGYEQKYKNIKDTLINSYKRREELLEKLNPLNRKIEKLEEARRNCKEKIRSL